MVNLLCLILFCLPLINDSLYSVWLTFDTFGLHGGRSVDVAVFLLVGLKGTQEEASEGKEYGRLG